MKTNQKDIEANLDDFFTSVYHQLVEEEQGQEQLKRDILFLNCAQSGDSKAIKDGVEYNFCQLVQERETLDVVDANNRNVFMLLLESAKKENNYKIPEIEIFLDKMIKSEKVTAPSKAYLDHVSSNKEKFSHFLGKIEDPQIKSEIIEKILVAHIKHNKYSTIESDDIFAAIFSNFHDCMSDSLVMFFAVTARAISFQEESKKYLTEDEKAELPKMRGLYSSSEKTDREFAQLFGIEIDNKNLISSQNLENDVSNKVPSNSTKKRSARVIEGERETKKSRNK